MEDAPRKAFENKELEIKFNFNYLDDDYLVAEWGNASPDDASDLLNGTRVSTPLSDDGHVYCLYQMMHMCVLPFIG